MDNEGLRFEPLGPSHRPLLRRFRCGEKALDDYLRSRAQRDQEQDLAAARILYDPDRNRIAGYYALSGCLIEHELLPEELTEGRSRYDQYPATLLGRMARDLAYADQRLGERLLGDALERSVVAAQVVASYALVVDAKSPEVEGFYAHYGFLRLETHAHQRRLFLPMDTILRLFS